MFLLHGALKPRKKCVGLHTMQYVTVEIAMVKECTAEWCLVLASAHCTRCEYFRLRSTNHLFVFWHLLLIAFMWKVEPNKRTKKNKETKKKKPAALSQAECNMSWSSGIPHQVSSIAIIFLSVLRTQMFCLKAEIQIMTTLKCLWNVVCIRSTRCFTWNVQTSF